MDPGRKSIDAGSNINNKQQSQLTIQTHQRHDHHPNQQIQQHPHHPSSLRPASFSACIQQPQQQQPQLHPRNGHIMSRGCKNRMDPNGSVRDGSCPASAGTRDDHENHNLVPAATYADDYSCGLLSFRPAWFQKLANKQSFLIIFSLTSILQGMYYTYFVSVLTTIEKLYQIQSKTTGIIMSATEIGQIGGALLLTYYGGQGHRPKWIAAGMLVFAAASFICAAPHFLFGGQSLLSSLPSDISSTDLPPFTRGDFSQSLCLQYQNSSVPSIYLSPYPDIMKSSTSRNHSSSKCDNEDLKTAQSKVTTWVLTIFFTSLFLIGIGSTAVNTLGIPYIDDNVAPRESPLYFGITIGVKIFGPVFGFLLGSVCTSIYVDFPFENPSGLSPSDPQWISAWWLGVLIVGTSLVLTAVPMIAFPKKLPEPDPSSYCHRQQQEIIREQQLFAENQRHFDSKESSLFPEDDKKLPVLMTKKTMESSGPALRDFPTAVKRLLDNKILLFRTASSVLHILPIAGLYTFLPKYLESQFQLTASRANMISGIAGILVMGFGIFASGIFMRKFKPKARFVAAWIAAAAFLYAIGMVILMFLGCRQQTNFAGLNANLETSHLTCGNECSCPPGEFSPICTSEGITYLSPCIAGCSTAKTVNLTYEFSDCKCLGPDVSAVNGNCEHECQNLIWYILIFSFFVLIHSTSEVGSMLLTLRCVEPHDKAMALGLVSFSTGLFGNVPCPIVYGAVVDSACLFWEKTCGQTGACRVYDADKFRFAFHGITAVIMFVAFFIDLIVWFMAARIKFDEEEEEEDDIEEEVGEQETTTVQRTETDFSRTAIATADAKKVKLKTESSV